MSPFLVYLMFQADSIKLALILLGILFMLVSIPLIAASLTPWQVHSWENKDDVEASRKLCTKASRWAIAVFVLFLPLGILTPSTNTIAAMVVLPKLTSPQALDAMGSEARDVYRLAKQALANLVDDSHASKADAKSEQP